MEKLLKAKEIIKEYYYIADCGIYNVPNIAGDLMDIIYDEEGLRIEICRYYSYFEVFGLTEEEFWELKKYYNSLEEVNEC